MRRLASLFKVDPRACPIKSYRCTALYTGKYLFLRKSCCPKATHMLSSETLILEDRLYQHIFNLYHKLFFERQFPFAWPLFMVVSFRWNSIVIEGFLLSCNGYLGHNFCELYCNNMESASSLFGSLS